MTQAAGDQTRMPGSAEAVPAAGEAADTPAGDNRGDLGWGIWERYGSSPGLVSIQVSRDLDARWSRWSGPSRLPLLAGLLQRRAAPETEGYPDRRELPLVWPGGPGQPPVPARASTSGTPQARRAAPPGFNQAYPLAPFSAHDAQPSRLASAPAGPVQRQISPSADRRPGSTTGRATGPNRPSFGAPGNLPGSPEAGPDAAPAAAPAGLPAPAPGPDPAQRESNLGRDILARHTGLPLVSRAGIFRAGSAGQTPVDRGPGVNRRSGRPVSIVGPADPVLPLTRATAEVRRGARTTENTSNPPLPRGGQDIPHMPEEEVGSPPLVKMKAESPPFVKGDPGEIPSHAMSSGAGPEQQSLLLADWSRRESVASLALTPAGAGAYGLGLSLVQRYGGAPSARQSPSHAGPALPLASANRPNAEEYDAGPASNGTSLPGPDAVTRETTAAAAPLVSPINRPDREARSQNRGLALSHPVIGGDMAALGRSRGEPPFIILPTGGAISPGNSQDAGSVRDGSPVVGTTPQGRFEPGYLESLPHVPRRTGPLPGAPAGPAATLPRAGRALTGSSSLTAGTLARAPLPAAGGDSYVNQWVADPTLSGRSESPQPVAMPLARQGAQNGTVAAAGMGVPTARAGGASRSAPGPSAPTQYRPAMPQAGVIARDSAPGSPPPAPSAGSGQQPGPGAGEADLERLADRVYTIIQRRLVLEKESLGI